MRIRLILLSMTLVTLILPVSAQEEMTANDSIEAIASRYAERLDSIANSIIHFPANRNSTISNASTKGAAGLSNPYYFPLFASTTLLHFPIMQTMGTMTRSNFGGAFAPTCMQPMTTFLAESYARQPWFISFDLTPTAPQAGVEVATSAKAPSKADNSAFSSRIDGGVAKVASHLANDPAQVNKPEAGETHEPEILDLSDFHIHVRRPNFWKVKGSFSTQFMQYYVSDNWYKGGENHISMLGQFIFEANYDNKQKITFSNKLETKLGFQTSPSDEYHTFKTNADQLRLTNKFGLQAHKHWYYSAMLQSWTQFYKAYKSNSPDVSSNFMSPFESVLSLGMDYKLDKKRVNFNINVAPAALDYKFCRRKDLINSHIKDNEHPDRHYKVNLGSTLTANMTLKICKQVNWQSRFYFFYNYKTDIAGRRDQVKWEWENTINLKVNKYLSSKIFLYPRYEGGLKKNILDPETGNVITGTRNKIQFNEYLSVGFDINF